MRFTRSAISLAISSAFCISTVAWAASGTVGANGESFVDGVLTSLIKETSVGAPGATGSGVESGGNGANIENQQVIYEGESADQKLIITGVDGSPAPSLAISQGGATGWGGIGGGTVAGGVSTGGAGGSINGFGRVNVSGGQGGSVTGSTLTLSHVQITGGRGGNGGDWGHTSSAAGSAGGGGDGGGSVFGGISRGGTGGSSAGDVYGGRGGQVSGNVITISQSVLTGGDGGDGGNSIGEYTAGTSGRGGLGGASIVGGASSGGGAGTSPSSSVGTRGGMGGWVSDNLVIVSDTTLNGGAGGKGGTSESGSASGSGPSGASGAGGHGGGSIFGGWSTGGASTAYGGGAGGWGGLVSRNVVDIQNTRLHGGVGGEAGGRQHASTTVRVAASGAGGHGGGSIFGGLSEQGTTHGETYDPSWIAGDVSLNVVTVRASELYGNKAGLVPPKNNTGGGGGAGGYGGGSIFGGVSNASASTGSDSTSLNYHGQSGDVTQNIIHVSDTKLHGAIGSSGGDTTSGSGGAGGFGGGVVVGGVSSGGSRGSSFQAIVKSSGGNVDGNQVFLSGVELHGANAGAGGAVFASTFESMGAGGAGGAGGGSVFGGISTAGSGGGDGGDLNSNQVVLSQVLLVGADGGDGGDAIGVLRAYGTGGGGIGGHGGASVIAASSAGAAGVREAGGQGGNILSSALELNDVVLQGGKGGDGGNSSTGGGAGAGGLGGGSVVGGISIGGAGGAYAMSSSASAPWSVSGGTGGSIQQSQILLHNVQLIAGAAGAAGSAVVNRGGDGVQGLAGGSVFGGVSLGGAGGVIAPGISNRDAAGGNGGDISGNTIIITGASAIEGDVYGGYSAGGAAGFVNDGSSAAVAGAAGQGGRVENNTVSLTGAAIQIAGGLYGGWSVDGDGTQNQGRAFIGNTLNLNEYQGSVKGIYNFENYNWVLPKDVVNQSEIISITGSDRVQLENTKHTIAMENDGNVLHAGDKVILISKAQGTPLETPTQIQQGLLIVYDVTTEVENDQFVLTIDNEYKTTPPDETPDGRLDPRSKVFVQGRLPMLAGINHGADMMSDYGMDTARSVLGTCGTNMFALGNGSSSHYETGSHIKVRDFDMAIGGAKCFVLPNQSTAMVGAFVEHGNGNFNSYDSLGADGDVRGWGDIRYTGAGLLFHMNVADTGTGKAAAAPAIGDKDGLYVNAAVRAGNSKLSFDSGLTDAEGVRGRYTSKAHYASVTAGAGYAWKLDAKQVLDVYGRYTFSRLGSDSVAMGQDVVHFDALKSSRVRVGGRYSYVAHPDMRPYVGVAYEHEFNGKSSGSAYGLAVESSSLQGGTGMVELGVAFQPSKENQAWTVNIGLQGFFGEREGMSGGVKARYAF